VLFNLRNCAIVWVLGITTREVHGAIPTGDRENIFSYSIHTTNIMPWVNGEKVGVVPDASGPAAEGLRQLMRNAQKSLDMAVYGVQKESWFFQEMKGLLRKRVGVRAVVDQDAGEVGDWKPENFTYRDTVELQKILAEDAVVPDQSQNGQVRTGTIMHNKFVLADRRWVWTGSSNISHTCLGAEYNANVSIVVDSQKLARVYHQEFEQMFYDLKFSIYKEPSSQGRSLRYSDGTTVEVYFSPKDRPIDEGIIPLIHDAQRKIDIAMFYLTHPGITEALGEAVARGVKVRLIADAVAAAHPSAKVKDLREKGIDVRVENWGGKMHMKAALVDDIHVVVGSMNWTEAGDRRNDENTLIIRNNQRVADDLGGYFNQLWATLKNLRNDVRAESLDSINSCEDGIDNDHDGQVDQKDSGCRD